IVGDRAGPDGQNIGRPQLTAPQKQQLIQSVRASYAGACKHGEPLILDGMIEDVKRLSNTPAEMDWAQSAATLKARITQTFGTNPIIMGEIESANRASAVAAEEHFAKFTVNPKIDLLSQVLTEFLGPMFSDGSGKLIVWIEPYTPRDEEMELRR